MFSCVYLRGHVSRGDLGAEILCPVVDWMYVRSWRTTALYLRFERQEACCVFIRILWIFCVGFWRRACAFTSFCGNFLKVFVKL